MDTRPGNAGTRMIFQSDGNYAFVIPQGVPMDLPVHSANYLNAHAPAPILMGTRADAMIARDYLRVPLLPEQLSQRVYTPYGRFIPTVRNDYGNLDTIYDDSLENLGP